MLFSDRFEVSPSIIKDYGAVNISIICDIPLFIDPMLIFNSKKPEYKSLHEDIIRFFHYLATKAQTPLSEAAIRNYFSFKEVKQNWLGYTLIGNEGSALGVKFAHFLYSNIGFALNNNGISRGKHIEKAMLLYSGSGKDKISDMTVNIIKGFLADYTQEFAKKHIKEKYRKTLSVDRSDFNYKTESFIDNEYDLPYIINDKGQSEYILLTPYDILRKEEPSINKDNFYRSHERIRQAIDNDILRFHVESYIARAIQEYEEAQRRNKKRPNENTIKKIERNAFAECAQRNIELYDYYIKLRETDVDEIIEECSNEVNIQTRKFIDNSKNIIQSFNDSDYIRNQTFNSSEEAKARLEYFKHLIEDCDVYKNFYVDNERIANENDLQRMFRLIWYNTEFRVDKEANNTYSDFIVSTGTKNQCIVVFKLASNSKLLHVFEQVKIYDADKNPEGSLIAIFYFAEVEYDIALNIIKNAGHEDKIGEGIFLIDCRNDNKSSASRVS